MTEVLQRVAESTATLSVVAIKKLRVTELRDNLAKLKLDTRGNKAELQNRLIKALHPASCTLKQHLSIY
jgi:hypothetical protein